jgi:hypothetical protein
MNPPPFRPLWKRLLRLTLILTLTPVILLLSCQSKLIYHPQTAPEWLVNDFTELGGQPIEYSTATGKQVAWYLPANTEQPATAPLWIAFSGNAALALHWLPIAQATQNRVSWLMIDYPGYGKNQGKASPNTIRSSARQALATLADQCHTTTDHLTSRSRVIGHSLGAAAALITAEDIGIHRGILISPFTSMTDMARGLVGWPLCHLNTHRFDNAKALTAICKTPRAQFTIFHGTEDNIIPYHMSETLQQSHPQNLKLQPVTAGHNDLIRKMTQNLVTEILQQGP